MPSKKDGSSSLPFAVRPSERRGWRIQRIGWVVLGGIVVLAAAGGLGDGPLSARTIETPDGTVHYQRIERVERPTEMHEHRSPRIVVGCRCFDPCGELAARMAADATASPPRNGSTRVCGDRDQHVTISFALPHARAIPLGTRSGVRPPLDRPAVTILP